MSDLKWFSTKLRFAIMADPIGADTLNDCLFILKATDFEAAFERAISIGHASEKEYRNSEGRLTQWRFKEIIFLDVIRSEDLDGCEVYSEPIHLSSQNMIPFEFEFSPRTSKPLQTI